MPLIRKASVKMQFYFDTNNQDVISSLFNLLKENSERAGIEFHFRIGLKNLNEVEEYFKEIVASKEFGLSPTYYLDVIVKPEILLGVSSVVPAFHMSVGFSPPSYLHIEFFSCGKIRELKTRNLVEKLNFVENLMIKLLEEMKLLPLLTSDYCWRWVSWKVYSPYSNIRKEDYWIMYMKRNFVSNRLFPLTDDGLEEIEENMDCYHFQDGDFMICIPKICLHHEIRVAQDSTVSFRFIIVFAKEDSKLFDFILRFDEIFVSCLSIINLLNKADFLKKRLGVAENNLAGLLRQLPKARTSDMLMEIESVEPIFWGLKREHSAFMEEVKYIKSIVKNRHLYTYIEELKDKVIDFPDTPYRLFFELFSTLGHGLKILTSEASLLDYRFKSLSEEFKAIKDTLISRAHLTMERQNILIQNVLGLLQTIAVMVFSFELMTYFYPFVNDIYHILIYVLGLIIPSFLTFHIFRKLTSPKQNRI